LHIDFLAIDIASLHTASPGGQDCVESSRKGVA
jgi:hypothetical protein